MPHTDTRHLLFVRCMGCAESSIAPTVSEEEFRNHIEQLRAQNGMPHLSIVKQVMNEKTGIFLAGGDARAVAADLLSVVQKSLPFMELVDSDSPKFEVAIKLPNGAKQKERDEFNELWSYNRYQWGHGLCDNGSMAVLDMMETHGYTLLNMQHDDNYMTAIFRKALA